eukprot:g2579.t1
MVRALLAVVCYVAPWCIAAPLSSLSCKDTFYGVSCDATGVLVRSELDHLDEPSPELLFASARGGALSMQVKRLKARPDVLKIGTVPALPKVANADVAIGERALIIAEAHDWLNQGHLIKDCFIPLCVIVKELKPTSIVLPLKCPNWIGEKCRKKLEDLVRALAPQAKLLTPDALRGHPVSFARARVVSLSVDIAAQDGRFPAGWSHGLPSCAQTVLPRLLGSTAPIIPRRRPSVLIVSRRGSRKLTNEVELVKEAKSAGFDAHLVSQWDVSIADQAKLMQAADVFVAVHGAVWGNVAFLRSPSVVIQLVPDCMWSMPHYKLCFKSPHKKVLYYKKMSELTGATYLQWETEHSSQQCPDAEHDPYCRGGHKKDVNMPKADFITLLEKARAALQAHGANFVDGNGGSAAPAREPKLETLATTAEETALEAAVKTSRRSVWPGITENVKQKMLVDEADSAAKSATGTELRKLRKALNEGLANYYKLLKVDWAMLARLWHLAERISPQLARCAQSKVRVIQPRAKDHPKKLPSMPQCATSCSDRLAADDVDVSSVLMGGSQVSWRKSAGKSLLRFGYTCEGCPGHKPRSGNRLKEFEIAQRLNMLPQRVRRHFSRISRCERCTPAEFKKFDWLKRACEHLKNGKATAKLRHPTNHWAYDKFVCDGEEGHRSYDPKAVHVFTEVELNALEENSFNGKGTGTGSDPVAALAFVLQVAASLAAAHDAFGFVHNDLGVNAGPQRPRVQNFGAARVSPDEYGRCFCYELPAYTGVTQPLCTDLRVTKGYAVRFYDFDNAKQGAWGEREFHSKEVQHAARGILRTFAGPSIGIDKDID